VTVHAAPTGAERRRVLVVTEEVIAPAMAGPGIRALRIAEFLAPDHDVTLYSFARLELEPPGIRAVAPQDADIAELIAETDVVICQGGDLLRRAPQLRDDDAPKLIADLYDPVLLEQLEQRRVIGTPASVEAELAPVHMLNDYLTTADHIICATDRQRGYWIGHMASLGSVTQSRIDADPGLTTAVITVPFGIDGTPPETEGAIKGRVAGIGADDRVVLWGGGIHDWFDPIVAVEAMGLLAERRPSARLFFLGKAHPNPNVPPMPIVQQTLARAEELGLLGKVVFFNEGWVEHSERGAYFTDADCAISTHHLSLEAEFSFRTRMLDYLWASLPIVCTEGDVFADLVAERGAGASVPPDDAEALASALERMMYDDSTAAAASAAAAALSAEYQWTAVLGPVADAVAAPTPAREFRRANPHRLAATAAGGARDAQQRIGQLETALASSKREIDELRASTSWRMTAPLRAIRRRR
jgi:glycosyltransferase involved in cell wall biosynthesis